MQKGTIGVNQWTAADNAKLISESENSKKSLKTGDRISETDEAEHIKQPKRILPWSKERKIPI